MKIIFDIESRDIIIVLVSLQLYICSYEWTFFYEFLDTFSYSLKNK